jgi:hypothetical protein
VGSSTRERFLVRLYAHDDAIGAYGRDERIDAALARSQGVLERRERDLERRRRDLRHARMLLDEPPRRV